MNAGQLEMVGLMANPALPSDDAVSKKIRKPYTITKSRESWTEQEHDKFLEALQLFDRDWKKIEAFVGSKTVIQIRSHAQKYFLKVQKNGTGEHVPPPRPKRKSAQPYPQKAVKPAPISRATPQQSPPDFTYMVPQQCNMYVPAVTGSPVTPWIHHALPQTYNYKDVHQAEQATPATAIKNNQNNNNANSWSQNGAVEESPQQRAVPTFSEVYKFLGSIFDPDVTGHLKKLREMAPIDKETVLLLMRNLAINLSSPDFDERLFVSASEMDCGTDPKTEPNYSEIDHRGDEAAAARSIKMSQDAASTATAAAALAASQQDASIRQTVADMSKHQRHPYDGGGQDRDQEQEQDQRDRESDQLYNLAEVLQESEMVLGFDHPASTISDEEPYGIAAAAALPTEKSIESWF